MTYEDAKILESYWHIVQHELQDQIQREMMHLRSCHPEELYVIQARIKVYEQLMTLPYDVAERLATRG